MRGRLVVLVFVWCLVFVVACAPGPTAVPAFTRAPTLTVSPILVPSHTPLSFPSHTPSSLPSYTPTPLPTSTPVVTLVPTMAPDVVTTAVGKVLVRLAEADIEPLCLRWEDTDGDGATEWLGLYLRPSEPPRLTVFVLDMDGDVETWYDLRPPDKEPGKTDYGLGQYPTCEIEVRDTNVDGRVEILVWGHAEASTTLLHIFAWDGTDYVMLAAFEGDAGIRLDNADGDLADEVSVRYDAGSSLVWEAVHTWDGANYGWTWERYDWFYLDHPHFYVADTPEHAVISFYLAIDDRDIPGAYGLLSSFAQANQSYEEWAVGFAATLAAEVGVVHERSRSGDTAVVATQVLAYDNVDGRVFATLWDTTWTVVQTENGWRLASATTGQLDQWELIYYP